MRRRLIVVSSLAVLGMVGTVLARELEASRKGRPFGAPKVISWFNSKTGGQKTCLLVRPGEQIIFSVKADGAEKYLWEVDGTLQKDPGGASFKWTVPKKKGLWKVRVKAINKSLEQYVSGLVEDFRNFPWMRLEDRKKWVRDTSKKDVPPTIKDGYYPPQCRKEWIVSTFLKQVKPAESIQKAIDAVPSEGGIVEFLPGRHDVRETITINRSNVTVAGTHDSEIRSLVPTKDMFRVNENWHGGAADPRTVPNLKNITFRGFKVTTTYKPDSSNRRWCTIRADKVDDLTVEGLHASCKYLVNVNWSRDLRGRVYFARSKGMRIVNNTLRHCHMESVLVADAVVAYNSMIGRCSWGYGMKFEAANKYISIHDNYLEDTASGANIQTESYGAHVFNNVCVGSRIGIAAHYNPWDSRIENNTITETTHAGIQLFSQKGLKNAWVRNNRIYNCPGCGIEFGEPHWGKTKGSCNIFMVNNVIYNNGDDGIRNGNRVDTPWTVKIANNVIANNAGYGINLAHKNVTETHSYNNIWNNKKGKYNKSATGTGDISADPLFADPSKGDFHLKSKAGRWDPKAKEWVKDAVHSPCIDAGDPKVEFSKELAPNGRRVNIGAYGSTHEASKSAD